LGYAGHHPGKNRDYIISGQTSCEKVTEYYLQQIRNSSRLNAFLSVFDESALEKARLIDQKMSLGTSGRLAGMIIAVKDNIMTCFSRTTCASKILENFSSPYEATVIRRLESEDAIIIGKTNMDEFGMGSSTENSAFGPVRNPHDESCVAGGSSGGSAAAVAAGCSMAALGSDTGGSVRQPAAHCGVIGLRPTYGRISRFGLVAFASSLDQIGILSGHTDDCARIFEVIAGYDANDSTSSMEQVPDFSSVPDGNLKGLRIGLPGEYFQEGLQPEIRSVILNMAEQLAQDGAEIRELSLPMTEYGIAAYYLICTAEASSNLARFDGVRYGIREKPQTDLNSMFCATRSRGFGSEVKRRIMLGSYVLSAGYYDAYYLKAQKVRTLIHEDFKKAFRNIDVIIGPTTPTTAFKIGEKIKNPMEMYLSDFYTVMSPLAGIPCISVPVGADDRNMPIGMQITAPAFREDSLFRISHWIEKNLTP
jgi:aspartyl-tRNA(Asn)/glutamyl-tRNA(Gln) amidotransferase subunit A